VQSFIYGGQVDLDTDIGKNDEGATTYAQLLICRKTGLELSLASFVQGYNFNSTTNLEISGSFNGADAETIKLYHTTDSSKDYFFESNLGSCPYGGNTGSEFKPTINYTWGDLVDKEFCVVKDENYAGTTACDLLQFAKVIEKQDQKEFQVKLMYDNYSESALKATENAAFFTNFDNIRILDYSGNPIGVLNPGIYNVNIVQKDNDLDVYLAYVSSYSPNQIFYYMPVDNTGSGLISGVGTAVDKQLSYAAGSEGVFSLVGDEDKSALKQYEVKNYSFKELNTTEIGSVFSGYFNDNLIYYNPMKIFKLTETIPKDENITLNCSDVPEYGSELCEILLHGWTVEKTEGEYIYAENDGIRFEIVENGEIKELKIINLTNVEKTIERIVYSNAVNLSALNVAKEITGLSIDNLESLYDQISKGNVCYKSVEGGSEYYYNPVKLLDMIKQY